ncbi:hypothetical protein [Winogradskyella sp. PG-2]|uniref:hypothetical protein n=1 Tax=Winogradskyella sp. PG-2 TaxID=754409 RepID=UPI00045870E2|nr:hypothetical protein [Winogradskyella sp. PG-2]BAO74931.1 hypothetical protein WPG_0701 [Winogradskyella sp. PG-2]
MNTITRLVVYLVISLTFATVQSQNKENDSIQRQTTEYRIKILTQQKEKIRESEKAALKLRIEAINKQLDNDEITAANAEELKKAAAQKAALNIEDRTAIINSKIELIKRNGYDSTSSEDEQISLSVGSNGVYINLGPNKKQKPKYDIRTSNKLLFAIGFNNTIGDGQSLDDSPYKKGGSGFVELGWVWETRLFKDSNFARLNYGFSFQWNKLNIKNNQYFVQDGDETTLQEFPLDLKKAKLRVTNLVLPVHFEFGPSKKRDFKDRLRYTTDNHFKIGLGGFGGVRLGTQQKLLYEDEDGNRVKNKEKRNFNTSNFVYGLSGYIGFGDLSIYAKYDLSPLFKDQAFEQNNISLGLRWDLD